MLLPFQHSSLKTKDLEEYYLASVLLYSQPTFYLGFLLILESALAFWLNWTKSAEKS